MPYLVALALQILFHVLMPVSWMLYNAWHERTMMKSQCIVFCYKSIVFSMGLTIVASVSIFDFFPSVLAPFIGFGLCIWLYKKFYKKIYYMDKP